MNENDILGFDPSQLSVFVPQEKKSSNGNPLIYHTRPADSKSEDKVYRTTIKLIYSPYDRLHSVLEQQSYSLQDCDGYLNVVTSLTNNDTNCPIFKAWKKCHFTKKEENPILWKQAAKVEEGGNELFQKRYARYITIQVLDDKNQPDLVGKYLFWKVPKSIWDIINAKMNPSKESGKPSIPVMDFLFGRAIDIEVKPGPGAPTDKSWTRETSYLGELSEDVVSCTNPDGSPLLTAAERPIFDAYVSAMKQAWKEKDPAVRETMINSIKKDPNTTEFAKIYARLQEHIKEFCPDINKELGYKPWAPEVTARVQRWIDCVLRGENPAEMNNAPEAAKNAGNDKQVEPVVDETPTNTTTNTDPFTSSNVDSDLPF